MFEMLRQQNSKKFLAISLSHCLDVSGAARELVDVSGVLELRWRHKIGQKMATVLGTLRSTPPSNSNEYCACLKYVCVISQIVPVEANCFFL
jgi:hypothetical protein